MSRPGPEALRVHAVRRIDASADNVWLAVELTGTGPAGSWSPRDLEVVDPDGGAVWGGVYDVRLREVAGWVPADEAVPVDARLRLGLEVAAEPPGLLALRLAGTIVAKVDLARADLALLDDPAAAGPGKPAKGAAGARRVPAWLAIAALAVIVLGAGGFAAWNAGLIPGLDPPTEEQPK